MLDTSKPMEIASIYFNSLHELQDWYNRVDNLDISDKLLIARESLERYSRSDEDGEKLRLQIIHDFQNGYQDEHDLNPNGYFPSKTPYYYFMQFPQLCDEFVYFSHHRVSVPPVSWVNQCHKNGICCLGTVIFEGHSTVDYMELDKFVDKDTDGVHFKYVKMLVELCKHYHFDGFLINIETRFSKNDLGLLVIPFISSLQLELKLINRFSKIVWYDSYVSNLNRVSYGNGITDNNYPYMKISDSMLTNYWWTEDTLQRNILLGGTKANLFVGCDVWGRGMRYGDGGFDTSVLVLKVAKYGNNCGIFAPAWTFEYFEPLDFERNDTKFWLMPNSRSISDMIKPHNSTVYIPTLGEFIFYTNFSTGSGVKYFENGELLMNDNWINGSLTFEVPMVCYEQKINEPLNQLKIGLYDKDAYQLGHSLKIDLNLNNKSVNLFGFNQWVKLDLNLKLSFKYLSSGCGFNLVIGYDILRVVKSSHKVREGTISIPLDNHTNWTKINKMIKLPQHNNMERVMLKYINIEYDQTDELIDEWVIISKKFDSSLLIGDIGLSSITKPEPPSIFLKKFYKDGQIGVRWDSNYDPLYWNIIVNDKFYKASVVPYLFLDKVSKVRIDIITRDGECIKGEDMSI